jgi:hypothetical protein
VAINAFGFIQLRNRVLGDLYPERRASGNTWEVSTPQYTATLHAVAGLDHAMGLLMAPNRPDLQGPGWTPELTNQVVDGMRACRWFLAAGFDPSDQFGFWLRTTMDEAGLGTHHGGDAGTAAWLAADAVDQLNKEWRSEWSMTDQS